MKVSLMNSEERYEATAHVGAARKYNPICISCPLSKYFTGVRNWAPNFMPWDHTIYQWYSTLYILAPSIFMLKMNLKMFYFKPLTSHLFCIFFRVSSFGLRENMDLHLGLKWTDIYLCFGNLFFCNNTFKKYYILYLYILLLFEGIW